MIKTENVYDNCISREELIEKIEGIKESCPIDGDQVCNNLLSYLRGEEGVYLNEDGEGYVCVCPDCEPRPDPPKETECFCEVRGDLVSTANCPAHQLSPCHESKEECDSNCPFSVGTGAWSMGPEAWFEAEKRHKRHSKERTPV